MHGSKRVVFFFLIESLSGAQFIKTIVAKCAIWAEPFVVQTSLATFLADLSIIQTSSWPSRSPPMCAQLDPSTKKYDENKFWCCSSSVWESGCGWCYLSECDRYVQGIICTCMPRYFRSCYFGSYCLAHFRIALLLQTVLKLSKLLTISVVPATALLFWRPSTTERTSTKFDLFMEERRQTIMLII